MIAHISVLLNTLMFVTNLSINQFNMKSFGYYMNEHDILLFTRVFILILYGTIVNIFTYMVTT